ncbi:MAG: SRPBCC family protein [Lysobacterales bacterium]
MSEQSFFGASFREVTGRTRDGKDTRVVSATRNYRTDPEDLWDALTTPERLARWFLPLSGELKPGGRYQLEGNAGGVIQQCQPPEKLLVSWEFGENISWLSVTLQAVDDGTQLVLEHEMATDPSSEAHWDQYGPGATGVGWDLALVGLQWHTDKTDPDFGKLANEDWMISESGGAFIKASTEAWEHADERSGQPSDIASRRSLATYKFYTGT